MCSCGGGLTVWCFDCSDWVCEFCGCDDPTHLLAARTTPARTAPAIEDSVPIDCWPGFDR